MRRSEHAVDLLDSEKMYSGFRPSNRYLIGVSGGRDSIALLHWLVEHDYKKLVVCHLNHQLRGRASRSDAQFVERIAGAAGLNCEIGSTDVRALAGKSKLSMETAARVARLAFFVSVARKRRCNTILLAHHADDLVETALLNLFRGASPGGVGAMREISVHRVGKPLLTIVRPLLGVWRRQIDAYVSAHALSFREDETNRSLGARRNQIRHRILPYIEKQLGRDVRKSIWRTAKIWSDEDALLHLLAADAAQYHRVLSVPRLRQIPVALQRRIIHSWLTQQGTSNLGFEIVENVRSLIAPGATAARTNLPRDFLVRRRNKKLFIEAPRGHR